MISQRKKITISFFCRLSLLTVTKNDITKKYLIIYFDQFGTDQLQIRSKIKAKSQEKLFLFNCIWHLT